MGHRRATAYIETEVYVNLDDFDLDDVIEYVEENGYTVLEGKSVTCGIQNLDDRIWILYDAWKHDKGDNDRTFEKEMRKFFADYYDKVSV